MNNDSLSVRLRILALPVLLAVGLFLFLSQPSSAFALDGEGAGEQVQSSDQTQPQDLDAPVPGATVPDPEEEPVFEEDQGPTGGSVEDQSDVRAYDDGRSHYLGDGQDDGQDDNQDQGQQPLADGIYRIASSAATSMTIDITNGSVDAGANVRTWTWNTTEAQCFQLVYDVASASYAILSAKSGLPISAASDTKGGNIYQGQASDPDLQRWYILPTATPGRYTISSASGSYAWDIANGSTAKGANIRLWTPNGTAAQTWIITQVLDLADAQVQLVEEGPFPYADGSPVTPAVTVTWQGKELTAGADYIVSYASNVLPGTVTLTVKAAPGAGSTGSLAGPSFRISGPTTPSIADGTYGVASKKHMARVMDVAGGSVASGANLQSYRWNQSEAQRYIFTFHEDGCYYTIISAKSGKALTLQSADPKANVFQADLEEGNVLQQWYVLKSGDYFIIESVAGAVVLDIANGSTSSGANIRGYGFNDTDAQKWELFDPDSKAVRVAASKAMNQAVQKILDSGGWSLWNAFSYIAHHYVWRWWYLYPSGDWMESYAWHIYSTGGGNCYCYAALFTYCAWALGYTSMTAVSGLCTGLGGWTPHGWAQMNGKIYDADLYYESGFSRNGYAITNGSYLSYRYL